MAGIESVAALGGVGEPLALRLGAAPSPAAAAVGATGFADLLAQGVRNVDARVAAADGLVRRFALDGSVPVHQVTMALEEARLAVELAMQVRSRLVESYRELMNMQL